jgi:hypothetical protein
MGGWRRLLLVVAAGLVQAVVYIRLSMTSALNSDSANILLAGSEMLHGNLLLHAWHASDVSFYSTEIPQYALLTGIFGVHGQTAHIAAGLTYTLVFLLAVLLAQAGATDRRQALIRTLIAAGFLLAPALGEGVFALDLSVGHIGTSVLLLITWLLLDWAERADWARRPAPDRWLVPAVTAILLAWVLVADPIVLIVGIAPLAAAGLVQVAVIAGSASGAWPDRLRAAWYPLSLIGAALAGYLLAAGAERVLQALGGYSVQALPFTVLPLHDIIHNWPALWKVLDVYGASFPGVHGVPLVLAFLHLASVLVAVVALLTAALRFVRLPLVDQILAVAIVVNIALFVLTSASTQAPNEVAIIVPFSAVLAARQLAGLRWERAYALAGILVLAGYAAGLGYELPQAPQPMTNTPLAAWLVGHHLDYGLSGYWTSSSVTVDSDGKAQVMALMQHTLERDLWMSDGRWYDSRAHYADFVVLDSTPGFYSHWEPVILIRRYFGTPAQVYRTGPYTIEVWRHNLLADIP